MLASGKTPAGMHRPIMVDEVLACLRPEAGDVAVDCTLGGGGHARAILERVQPGGRLIGLDVDPIELPRTEARLRAAGFGPETFVAHHGNFAGLPQVLAAEGLAAADLILADLGVSSMQLDNPDRGFSYKEPGPLDMRMNPVARRIRVATARARQRREARGACSTENADEPHADADRRSSEAQPVETTQPLDRLVRARHREGASAVAKTDLKMSVRRTLQALRIAVNDEFSALDALLRSLPQCLAPGGRSRDADVSLRRRPAREEGVSGGLSSRRLRRRGRRGHSLHDGRNARESTGLVGEVALGRPRIVSRDRGYLS